MLCSVSGCELISAAAVAAAVFSHSLLACVAAKGTTTGANAVCSTEIERRTAAADADAGSVDRCCASYGYLLRM